ncbi:hypothetical protein [Amycolatopsis orientalis]|uniref:hypothetical protein n=1 Tax=Amycolatopsis orientalis TaxID=31958 RepID=UPI000426ACC2|nr:hypothetical protein [Amycolatopsis orientalis]
MLLQHRRVEAGARPDRLVALIFHVIAGVGISRRTAVRIARDLRGEGLLPDPVLVSREDRDRVVSALQLVLESRVDKGLLAKALEDAVLLDEYRALPAPQRVVVEAVVERRRSIPAPAVAAELGLSPEEVRTRLNEALRGVAASAWVSP